MVCRTGNKGDRTMATTEIKIPRMNREHFFEDEDEDTATIVLHGTDAVERRVAQGR